MRPLDESKLAERYLLADRVASRFEREALQPIPHEPARPQAQPWKDPRNVVQVITMMSQGLRPQDIMRKLKLNSDQLRKLIKEAYKLRN